MLSWVEPIIFNNSSEKFKPNEVTKKEVIIANIIDWATYNDAVLFSLAPTELLIKAWVPAWIPIDIAKAIKVIGQDLATAARASGEILPAKKTIYQIIESHKKWTCACGYCYSFKKRPNWIFS